MSAKPTKNRIRKTDVPTVGRTDLARLHRMTDAEIERTSPPELKNLPKDFWEAAELVPPVAKEAISLRVDIDVLAWFRDQGPRYQSRMNAVLRAYMQAKRPSVNRRASQNPQDTAVQLRKQYGVVAGGKVGKKLPKVVFDEMWDDTNP